MPLTLPTGDVFLVQQKIFPATFLPFKVSFSPPQSYKHLLFLINGTLFTAGVAPMAANTVITFNDDVSAHYYVNEGAINTPVVIAAANNISFPMFGVFPNGSTSARLLIYFYTLADALNGNGGNQGWLYEFDSFTTDTTHWQHTQFSGCFAPYFNVTPTRGIEKVTFDFTASHMNPNFNLEMYGIN